MQCWMYVLCGEDKTTKEQTKPMPERERENEEPAWIIKAQPSQPLSFPTKLHLHDLHIKSMYSEKRMIQGGFIINVFEHKPIQFCLPLAVERSLPIILNQTYPWTITTPTNLTLSTGSAGCTFRFCLSADVEVQGNYLCNENSGHFFSFLKFSLLYFHLS